MSDAQCLMVNCRRSAPASEAFCSEHRPASLHRELQDRGGSLNMRSLAFITDCETWEGELLALLQRSREYVTDSLEAHEHSDGRALLNEIDAALAKSTPAIEEQS